MIVLHITTGTPRTGLWCESCLKPAAVEVPLNTIGAGGVSTIGHVTRCLECG